MSGASASYKPTIARAPGESRRNSKAGRERCSAPRTSAISVRGISRPSRPASQDRSGHARRFRGFWCRQRCSASGVEWFLSQDRGGCRRRVSSARAPRGAGWRRRNQPLRATREFATDRQSLLRSSRSTCIPRRSSSYQAGQKLAIGSPSVGSILKTVAPASRRRDTASGPGALTAIVTMRIPARTRHRNA